jgi:hypothetical protein
MIIEQKIIEYLEDKEGSLLEIQDGIKYYTYGSLGHLKAILPKMVRAGLITRKNDGRYKLKPIPKPTNQKSMFDL